MGLGARIVVPQITRVGSVLINLTSPTTSSAPDVVLLDTLQKTVANADQEVPFQLALNHLTSRKLMKRFSSLQSLVSMPKIYGTIEYWMFFEFAHCSTCH